MLGEMMKMFGKKEEPKPAAPQPAEVFEIGKPKTFKDPMKVYDPSAPPEKKDNRARIGTTAMSWSINTANGSMLFLVEIQGSPKFF